MCLSKDEVDNYTEGKRSTEDSSEENEEEGSVEENRVSAQGSVGESSSSSVVDSKSVAVALPKRNTRSLRNNSEGEKAPSSPVPTKR